MNATILSEVLFGLASKSKFSQGINIEFETKQGYTCSTYIFLRPQYYHIDSESSKIEFQGYKHDFSVIFKIENDPNFSKWLRITFSHSSDGRQTEVIGLQSEKYYEPERSHYSGQLFVSWMDYVDVGYRIHYSSKEPPKKTLKERFNKLRGLKNIL